MPKSAKKRKAKAADFSKSKLKLGKGRQLASNAIDTSFKARSIALPSQSITKDKDSEAPTTKRRLTFEDLVAHSKHYAAGTRKDAILGLRELLEAYPGLIQPSLTALFGACARLIGDEDAGVRKVLLAFFSWLLPRIPKEQLAPHASTLLLFTTSAQTHIFPEIRIDAVRFLDLLLECTPESIVVGWNQSGDQAGKRVLEGYLGLLNAGTKYGENYGTLKATSTASVVLMPASKLVVLKSLSSFVRHAIASTKASENPRWYFASSFSPTEAYEAFDKVLQPASNYRQPFSTRRWVENFDDKTGNEDFVMEHSAVASSPSAFYLPDLLAIAKAGAAEPNFIVHLAEVLHSTLVSTFLDCSPIVFSPAGNPPETELHLASAVAEIARAVYGEILQSPTNSKGKGRSSADSLVGLLGHMAPFFPFSAGGRRDIKVEQALRDLNIIYCELSSLLLSSQQESEASSSRSRSGIRIDAVRSYVLLALSGDDASATQSSRLLTSAAYAALLPTIWTLVSTSDRTSPTNDILDAAVLHAISISAKSALKKPATEFICRLILLDTDIYYTGHVRLSRHLSNANLESFLEGLPKTLWEVGNSNVELSEAILRFLLRFLQRSSKAVPSKILDALRSRLAPFFAIVHPTRGPLPGPYTKLPFRPLRHLVLDVAAHLLPGDGLNDAINNALVACPEERAYWRGIVCST